MEIPCSSRFKFITACSYSIEKYKDMMKAQVHVIQVFCYSDTQKIFLEVIFVQDEAIQGDYSIAFKTKERVLKLHEPFSLPERLKAENMVRVNLGWSGLPPFQYQRPRNEKVDEACCTPWELKQTSFERSLSS
nr:hypothetical protein [Tanacetum cinerariifolium]